MVFKHYSGELSKASSPLSTLLTSFSSSPLSFSHLSPFSSLLSSPLSSLLFSPLSPLSSPLISTVLSSLIFLPLSSLSLLLSLSSLFCPLSSPLFCPLLSHLSSLLFSPLSSFLSSFLYCPLLSPLSFSYLSSLSPLSPLSSPLPPGEVESETGPIRAAPHPQTPPGQTHQHPSLGLRLLSRPWLRWPGDLRPIPAPPRPTPRGLQSPRPPAGGGVRSSDVHTEWERPGHDLRAVLEQRKPHPPVMLCPPHPAELWGAEPPSHVWNPICVKIK